MRAIPIKPQYGPTLGRLLSPRWRAASGRVRALVVVACAGVVALLVGAAFTLLDAHLVHGGPVPFNFRYRGLYRVAADPGGYARVAKPQSGPVDASFAVDPLHVPAYSGSVTAELPLAAATRIRQLAATVPGFDLVGEGKGRVTGLNGYAIAYTERGSGGRTLYAREMLMLPLGAGAQDGVDVVMLSRPDSNITSPTLVGSTGILQLPLQSFAFGR